FRIFHFRGSGQIQANSGLIAFSQNTGESRGKTDRISYRQNFRAVLKTGFLDDKSLNQDLPLKGWQRQRPADLSCLDTAFKAESQRTFFAIQGIRWQKPLKLPLLGSIPTKTDHLSQWFSKRYGIIGIKKRIS